MPDQASRKAAVLFDAESYFAQLQSADSSPVRTGRFAGLPPGRPDLVESDDAMSRRAEIIYFLLRSAVVLTEGADDDVARRAIAGAAEVRPDVAALALAATHDPATLHAPIWVDMVIHNLRDSAIAEATIERVDVRTTLDLRLYARSFTSADRIEVSAVSYEYLRTINLLLWNLIFTFEEQDGLAETVDGLLVPPRYVTTAASFLLPLLASLSRDVSPGRLPILRAYDERAFRCAKVTTEIQLAFLLAHEYAHMELHREPAGGAQRMAREVEADRFAFEITRHYRGMRGEFEFGDVWTAIHWLFHILSTDSTLGAVLARSDSAPRNEFFNERVLRIEDYRMPFDTRDGGFTHFGAYLLQYVRQVFVQDRENVLDIVGYYQTEFRRSPFWGPSTRGDVHAK